MSVFLLDAFERAAVRDGTLSIVSGAAEETTPWAHIQAEATGLAGFLQALGVGRGTGVGLLGLTNRAFVTAIRAVWLAGASVTVVTPPVSGDPAEVAQACATAARGAELNLLLVCPPFDALGIGPALEAATGCPVVTVDDGTLRAGADTPYRVPALSDDDTALRQFTSGSVSEPKAVRITHGNLAANIDGMMKVSRHDYVHDCMVSWLPLFHDMGMIGFLTLPMACGGCRLVLSSPENFLARPTSWLENLSRFRATATAAPNFAYGLAARLLPREGELDLSALRFALCGGEPIDPEAMANFVARAGRFGFDPGALVCAFGMAEATLAVSLSPVGRGMRVDEVDPTAMEVDRVAVPVPPSAGVSAGVPAGNGGARFPTLGRPLPGIEVRVVDPADGSVRGEREVGELQLRGTSVSPGYVAEGSAPPGRDGWFPSGDLGYLVDGEIVVCGRLKELLIVAGRNVAPYEVERLASRVDGVRAGRVAAFRGPDRPGGDSLVVAVETRLPETDGLREEITATLVRQIGLRPREVVVLDPGTLPKTTSGKIRRTEIRRRYLAGNLVSPRPGQPV